MITWALMLFTIFMFVFSNYDPKKKSSSKSEERPDRFFFGGPR